MMRLKDIIDLIDPEMEGIAWFNFLNHHSELMCKANSCSSFLSPLYDRTVEVIEAEAKNEFNIYLEGEI